MGTAAIIGAIASLIGAGTGVAGTFLTNNRGAQNQYGLASAQLQDARNNEAYGRLLNTLAIQQSRAGYTDAQGNRIEYDPATNSWNTITTPQAAEGIRAEQKAALDRNTIDQALARRINYQAEGRALDAGLARGPALSAIQNYNPISGTELAGDLTQKAAIANEDAYRPARQDLIRSMTRTSSASGQPIADLASRQSRDLRSAIIDASIAGRTGAADINAKNLSRLLNTYTTLNANAQPQLQLPPVQTDNTDQILAGVAADRARTAATIPIYGANVATGATNASQGATNAAIGAVPNSNLLTSNLKGLGDIFTGDKIGKSVATIYNAIFGPSGTDKGLKQIDFPSSTLPTNQGARDYADIFIN